LLAVGADPVALIMFGGLLLTVLLSALLVWKAAVVLGRRIDRRLTARRCRREFDAIIDAHPDMFPGADQADAQPLPDLVLLDHTAPGPRRAVRRPRRFPRRPVRRPTSTSNSDRRTQP
jgi:hypothetical protein